MSHSWSHPAPPTYSGGPERPNQRCANCGITMDKWQKARQQGLMWVDECEKLRPPKVPEHDKMRRAREELRTQEIADFLEWCDEEGIHLAENDADTPYMVSIHEPRLELLSRYAGIDQTKVEDEKQALLEHQRLLNQLP